MLVVGELINASRTKVKEAITNKDGQRIKELVASQVNAGADYIDLNVAGGISLSDEARDIQWLVNRTQEVSTDIPIMIDSANYEVIVAGLAAYKGKEVIINSIDATPGRMDSVLPLVFQYEAKVVALTMGETGIPKDSTNRIKEAEKIATRLDKEKIGLDRVFFDPIILPLSTASDNGKIALETLAAIKKEFPGSATIAGLSNISYGLPKRALINRAYLVMAIYEGLDAAILDPTDREIIYLARAAEALAGRDPRLRRYMRCVRQW